MGETTDVRDFEVRYDWPNLWHDFVKKGRDYLEGEFSSDIKEQIPIVEVHINVHRKIGKIEIHNTGEVEGRLQNEQPEINRLGYREYVYVFEDVRPGTRMRLDLKTI